MGKAGSGRNGEDRQWNEGEKDKKRQKKGEKKALERNIGKVGRIISTGESGPRTQWRGEVM